MKRTKAIVYFVGSGGNFLSYLLNNKKFEKYSSQSNEYTSGIKIDRDYDINNLAGEVEDKHCYITHDMRPLFYYPTDDVIIIDSKNKQVLRYCAILWAIKMIIRENTMDIRYSKIEILSGDMFRQGFDLWKYLIDDKDRYISEQSLVHEYMYEELIIKGKVKDTLFEPYEKDIKEYHNKNVSIIHVIDKKYGTNLKRFIPKI